MEKHSNRTNARRKSSQIAFCGMLTGLSVALMLLGGIIPVATYAVPMFAGLLLLPALAEFGMGSAWAVWSAVSVLALTLGADKEAAFFYACIGCWPLLKPRFEHVHSPALRLVLKLTWFNVTFTAMYAVMALLFGAEAAVGEFRGMGIALFLCFLALYNACMLLYDRMLIRAAAIWYRRLRPKLKLRR